MPKDDITRFPTPPKDVNGFVTHDYLLATIEKIREITEKDNERRDRRIEVLEKKHEETMKQMHAMAIKQEEVVGRVRTIDNNITGLTNSWYGPINDLKETFLRHADNVEKVHEKHEVKDDLNEQATQNNAKAIQRIYGGLAVTGTTIGIVFFLINYFSG